MNFMSAFPDAVPPLALALGQASAASAALSLLVLALRRAGHGVIPVSVLYGLGLLAMVRLALPFVPESMVGLRWPFPMPEVHRTPKPVLLQRSPVPADPESTEKRSGQPEPMPGIAPAPFLTEPGQFHEPAWTPARQETETIPQAHPIAISPALLPLSTQPPALPNVTWIFHLAGTAWLMGAGLITLRACGQSVRFLIRVKQHARPGEERTLLLGREITRRMGIRRNVEVLEMPGLAGPVSCGWIRPRILLPQGFARRVTDAELNHILAHEAAHLKHFDSMVNCLLVPLCALHWFNPMVWLCRRAVLADRELIRDQQALRALTDAQDRASYGRTLLKISLSPQPSVPAPGLAAFFAPEKEIQRRITMLTRPIPTLQGLKKYTTAAAAALAVLCTFTLAPAQKTDPAATPPAASPDDLANPAPSSGSTQQREAADTALDIVARIAAARPLIESTINGPREIPGALPVSSETLPDPLASGGQAGPLTAEPTQAGQPVPGAPVDPSLLNGPVTAAGPEEPVLESLRQENEMLRRELAKIRQPGGPPSQTSRDLFENALEVAQLRKLQAESSGLASKHPMINQINEEISRLQEIIHERQAEREKQTAMEKRDMERIAAAQREEAAAKLREAAIQKEMLVGGGAEVPAGAADQRNGLIRKLIQFKAEAIKITTALEAQSSESPEIPKDQRAQELKSMLYDKLGDLRAQIEEIETWLKYNLMD